MLTVSARRLAGTKSYSEKKNPQQLQARDQQPPWSQAAGKFKLVEKIRHFVKVMQLAPSRFAPIAAPVQPDRTSKKGDI